MAGAVPTPPLPLRLFDGVIDLMNLIGSGLIAFLVVLVSADIVMRNVLHAPIIGVPEIIALSILAIVTLQLPYAVRGGRLTQSDAIFKRTRPQFQAVADRVFDLLGCLCCVAIVWYSWPLFTKAYNSNLYIGAIGTFTAPLWPARLTLVVSMAVLALQFLRQALGPRHVPVEVINDSV